ncbi:hypothetical protein ASG85_05185 [Paenibacillus sp. Soil724D2]|nr:hypothetical protein ASG85_05185 [Paenibacillus sp. Soil724D2]
MSFYNTFFCQVPARIISAKHYIKPPKFQSEKMKKAHTIKARADDIYVQTQRHFIFQLSTVEQIEITGAKSPYFMGAFFEQFETLIHISCDKTVKFHKY